MGQSTDNCAAGESALDRPTVTIQAWRMTRPITSSSATLGRGAGPEWPPTAAGATKARRSCIATEEQIL
jgi:hypothetical protein